MTQNNPTTFTLYVARDESPDEIVARGATCAEAMSLVAALDGDHSAMVHVEDYGNFRHFEWRMHARSGPSPVGLHATVPSTPDANADKAAAMTIIEAQFLRRIRAYWPGVITTDDAYDVRLGRIDKQRKVARIDKEISAKLIDALIAEGYTISGDLRDDVQEFDRSTDRDAILAHMIEVEVSEFHVHKEGKRYWFRMCFGEEGWDVVQDHSDALRALIDPIVDAYVPWNQPGADPTDLGFEVFVLNSPEDILAVADRLMR